MSLPSVRTTRAQDIIQPATPRCMQSSVENLPPQVIRRVTKEVLELAETPPEGIKVYVNEDDLTDIQATIEGPGKARNGAKNHILFPVLLSWHSL